jgi:hypothetical protein
MVRKVEVRMKAWTKPASDSLIGGTAVDLVKSKPELIVENAFLRQQLIVVTRHAKQPKLTPVLGELCIRSDFSLKINI